MLWARTPLSLRLSAGRWRPQMATCIMTMNGKRPGPLLTNSRVTSRFYSGSSFGEGNERWWAIGAIAVTIPAAIWIYRQHRSGNGAQPSPHPSAKGTVPNDGGNAVIISDLKGLPTNLGNVHANGNGQSTASSAAPAKRSSDPIIRAKYVLVGGGTASFAAMEEILKLEPNADILIIGDEVHPPYMRPPLSKELWFNSDSKATPGELYFVDWHGERKPIFYEDIGFYNTQTAHRGKGEARQKPRLLLGKKAVALDVEDKVVILEDGQLVAYERLLLATGGRPKQLPILRDLSKEVRDRCTTFRGADDLLRLLEVAQASERVAIIGGGFLGSELAVALAQFSKSHRDGALKVTQIFPEDGNMSLVFPRYLSRWTMGKMRRAGIKVVPNTAVTGASISPSDHRPIMLSLSDGSTVEADHVIVATGIDPNIEIAKSAGLELDPQRGGGLVTNAQLHVCKGVYAAGDLISFHDPSLGMRRRLEHYDHAVLTGRLAGSNMVVSANGPNPEKGLITRRYGMQSMFWSDLGPEIGYEAVGLIDSKLNTIGVWAEAVAEDTPKGADLDPSDIRAQPMGRITPRAPDPQTANESDHKGVDRLKSVIASPVGEKSYGKGVVFYVSEGRIVGVLMFNLFNRVELAREIIMKRTTVDDLQNVVELFNIGDK